MTRLKPGNIAERHDESYADGSSTSAIEDPSASAIVGDVTFVGGPPHSRPCSQRGVLIGNFLSGHCEVAYAIRMQD